MKHIFLNHFSYNRIQAGSLGNWVGIAGIIIAVVTLSFMCWWRYQDKKREDEVDSKTKDLLAKELGINLDIVNHFIDSINKHEIEEFRGLEDKVFMSIINSHRVLRFLSGKLIDDLFSCYNTLAGINNKQNNILAEIFKLDKTELDKASYLNKTSYFKKVFLEDKKLKDYLEESKKSLNNIILKIEAIKL